MGYNIVYFLNSIAAVPIAVISFYYLGLWYKDRTSKKFGKLMFLNGILYSLYAIVVFNWAIGRITPTEKDIILMGGIYNVIKAFLFISIIYCFTGNRNLFYLNSLFLIALLTLNIHNTIFTFLAIISYIIISLASLDLLFLKSRKMNLACILTIIYSIISVILISLYIFKGIFFMNYWFIPEIIMFFIFLFFNIKYFRLKKETKETKEVKQNKFLMPILFFKFILYIFLITFFVFIGTTFVHEFGHLSASVAYGCKDNLIVYHNEECMPKTESICDGYYNDNVITLAGVLLPIIIGIILYFIGIKMITNLSYLIIGFGIIISSKDLQEIHITNSSILIITLIGLIFLIYGISKNTSFFVKQNLEMINFEFANQMKKKSKKLYLDSSTSVTTLYEFLNEISVLSNLEYKELMKTKKHEFIKWLKDLQEDKLANDLLDINNKNETILKILDEIKESKMELDDSSIDVKKIPRNNANLNNMQKYK